MSQSFKNALKLQYKRGKKSLCHVTETWFLVSLPYFTSSVDILECDETAVQNINIKILFRTIK